MAPLLSAAAAALAALAAAAASPATPPAWAAEAPGRALARVGDAEVVALEAPGFDRLTREQRLLAYWLSQAGQAGAAIAYEQAYRHNASIVRLLRGILTHPQAVPPAVLPRVRAFAREVYLRRGLHDPETERKIAPPFSSAELRSAALAAQASGADFALAKGVSLETFLRSLEGPLFDPGVDPVRVDVTPGRDPLLSSATNLYQGVSQADLALFHERYAPNSRLVKEGGRLVEQIQRAGQPRDAADHEARTPAGLSSERLGRAVAALEQGARFANGPQLFGLRALQGFLRTGEPERFAAAERAFAQEATPVELVAGFLDASADPRGRKGLWLAFVGLRDPAAQEPLRKLASAAPQLQAALPWPAGLHPAAVAAAAQAVLPLSASGAALPLPSDTLHVPAWAAPAEATKGLLLTEDGETAARDARLARALSPPELAAEVARCRAQDRFLFRALREVVGRSAQPAEARGEGSRALPAALDEVRADAAAHFLAGSAEVAGLGLPGDPRCAASYPQFAAGEWLAALALAPQGDRATSATAQARQLEEWWFASKGAVALRTIAGKRALVADPARFRGAAGELWALATDLAARADSAGAARLLAEHGTRIDAGLRDEVLARIRALSLPRRTFRLPPSIEPVLADGKVVDALLEPAGDLDARILADWSSF